MPSIYKITNTLNGDFYIGKTAKSIHERLGGHRDATTAGSQTHLHRAMRKYGRENFKIEEIFNVFDAYELDVFEIYFIEELKPNYNMTKGGEGGYTADSENFKRGMKDYHDNRDRREYATYGFKGKVHSDESKKLLSEARQKYWDTIPEDELKKRRDKLSGEKNPMFGKTPGNAIKVMIDGKEYPSLAKAVRETGLSVSFIKRYHEVIRNDV